MSKMRMSLLDTLLFTCFTMWISSCVNYAGIADCLFIWSSVCILSVYYYTAWTAITFTIMLYLTQFSVAYSQPRAS